MQRWHLHLKARPGRATIWHDIEFGESEWDGVGRGSLVEVTWYTWLLGGLRLSPFRENRIELRGADLSESACDRGVVPLQNTIARKSAHYTQWCVYNGTMYIQHA